MNNNPFISIVVPAYNCENTIEKCLDSLIQISYPLYEIIVIDDGSTDKTPKLLKRYKDLTVITTKNKGPSHARNLGIKRAKGDFIAFTDSDCIVSEDWLGELLKGFIHENVAGVGGDQISPNDETPLGKTIQQFMKTVGFVSDYMKTAGKLVRTKHNPSCNVLYKKAVLLEAGMFDEKLWPGEDVEIDLKISRLGYHFYYNPKAVVFHYRPQTVRSFYKMMKRYGWAQAYLFKKYGAFRAIHYEPLALLGVFGVLLFLASMGFYLAFFSFIGISVILPFVLVLSKTKNLEKTFCFSILGATLLCSWNLGFIKGLWETQKKKSTQKKPVRILEVYYEPKKSGITRHVEHIVTGLKDDKNLFFYILCSTYDSRIPRFYRSGNIMVKQVAGAKYFSFWGMIEIFIAVRKWKIDIVHIHNLQSLFWANLPKIFLPSTRFFFTPQVINFESNSLEKIFYFIWRYFSVLTDKIIAISEYQKNKLANMGIKKESDIVSICNSIPPLFRSPDIKAEPLSIEIKNPCIVSAIRFVSQKNPLKIIDIARQVCLKHPDVTFYILGEGELQSKVKKQILKENLQKRVILPGYRKDALAIIQKADMVLSTSRWEGLPYSILEAMLLGKPTIATNIEGHRSLIIDGETGFLADSSREFSEKILTLLKEDSLKKQMGEKAKKLFDEKFSFTEFIRKTRDLYLE